MREQSCFGLTLFTLLIGEFEDIFISKCLVSLVCDCVCRVVVMDPSLCLEFH